MISTCTVNWTYYTHVWGLSQHVHCTMEWHTSRFIWKYHIRNISTHL